jgi:hypothetical protein
MTPKERWLAALRMQPVDRLPFWPKLGGNNREAQGAPFKDMETDCLPASEHRARNTAVPHESDRPRRRLPQGPFR